MRPISPPIVSISSWPAYVTDERLEDLQVTQSYFQSPVALIARTGDARRFLSFSDIARASNLTLGVLRYPVLVPLVEQLFPNARIVTLESYDELPGRPEIDAAIWSLAQARAWASYHPGYTAVGPANMGAPLIFAYFLPPESSGFTQFMDLWLALKARDGFYDAQAAYWIKGEARANRGRRWNLLDDVLWPEIAKLF